MTFAARRNSSDEREPDSRYPFLSCASVIKVAKTLLCVCSADARSGPSRLASEVSSQTHDNEGEPDVDRPARRALHRFNSRTVGRIGKRPARAVARGVGWTD